MSNLFNLTIRYVSENFRAYPSRCKKSGYCNKYCWDFSNYKWYNLCHWLRIR